MLSCPPLPVQKLRIDKQSRWAMCGFFKGLTRNSYFIDPMMWQDCQPSAFGIVSSWMGSSNCYRGTFFITVTVPPPSDTLRLAARGRQMFGIYCKITSGVSHSYSPSCVCVYLCAVSPPRLWDPETDGCGAEWRHRAEWDPGLRFQLGVRGWDDMLTWQ